MSPSNSALKFRELAMRAPRPYTSKIALNGSFRPQTKSVEKQVQKSFATQSGRYAARPPQPRDGETGGSGGGKGNKNREDELVSFTGEWTKS